MRKKQRALVPSKGAAKSTVSGPSQKPNGLGNGPAERKMRGTQALAHGSLRGLGLLPGGLVGRYNSVGIGLLDRGGRGLGRGLHLPGGLLARPFVDYAGGGRRAEIQRARLCSIELSEPLRKGRVDVKSLPNPQGIHHLQRGVGGSAGVEGTQR